MRSCIPGCIHVPRGGDLLCRSHWSTISLEKKRLLFVQWQRWQHGEITEKKYQRIAIDSLNSASILPAVALLR